MPIYRYTGQVDYTDLNYGLYKIKPNQQFTTPYVLPQEWADFELIDASDTNILVASTLRPVLPPGAQVTIDVQNYSFISVIKNAGTGMVSINLVSDTLVVNTEAEIGDTLQGIDLDLENYPSVTLLKLEASNGNPEPVEVIVVRAPSNTEIHTAASGSGGGGGGTSYSTDNMTSRLDYQGGSDIVYAGYAQPGSAETDPVWQIRKMDYDVNGNLVSVKFAEGTAAYDKIWANRTSYTYS